MANQNGRPIRVVIVGDHPHSGKLGNAVEAKRPLSCLGVMVRVEFDDGTSCFAKPENVRAISKRKAGAT